jgi:hypothetical protein
MKNLLNDMSFEERQKIREQHTGGMKVMSNSFTRLVNGKLGHINPLLNEQTDIDNFFEKDYVKPLTDQGFKQVNEINLPDGIYKKNGSGYQIDLMDSDGKTFTGYSIVTKNGIRGMWNGEEVEIVSKTLGEAVYKIFFKNSGYKPKQAQTPIYTITENSLINSQIPASVIQAPAPQTTVVNGRGSFKIQGSNDLYGYDFSSKLSTINGKYYFVSESSEYLNQNYAGKYNAKEGTQFCCFLDEDSYGKILYIGADGKSIVGRFAG